MGGKSDTAHEADWRPSPNFQPRRNGLTPRILLMHYTGMDSSEAAIDLLCAESSGVSCHYLVDEGGRITQMVREAHRAWHAGQAHWAGIEDVNSASIGIEIVNPGHDLGYRDFPKKQIDAVIALSQEILSRHDIPPQNVLAHSDVAPLRKKDPGEKFPWQQLHEAGVGHWVGPAPLVENGRHAIEFGHRDFVVAGAHQLFEKYGYKIDIIGVHDEHSQAVVKAFQRHFRPQRMDGRIDVSTVNTLERLLDGLEGTIS